MIHRLRAAMRRQDNARLTAVKAATHDAASSAGSPAPVAASAAGGPRMISGGCGPIDPAEMAASAAAAPVARAPRMISGGCGPIDPDEAARSAAAPPVVMSKPMMVSSSCGSDEPLPHELWRSSGAAESCVLSGGTSTCAVSADPKPHPLADSRVLSGGTSTSASHLAPPLPAVLSGSSENGRPTASPSDGCVPPVPPPPPPQSIDTDALVAAAAALGF